MNFWLMCCFPLIKSIKDCFLQFDTPVIKLFWTKSDISERASDSHNISSLGDGVSRINIAEFPRKEDYAG